MRYFKDAEFIMDGEVVYSKMQSQFLALLDQLRGEVGEPLLINSSYRSEEYNEQIGGVKNSMHVHGRAVDLHCDNSRLRAKIVRVALSLGLTVGVNSTFIHVDNRDNQIMFTY